MTYRVYFNRRGSEPWSVDEGTQATERTCAGVILSGCAWRTREMPLMERIERDRDVTPWAWIEVEASGIAFIDERIVFIGHSVDCLSLALSRQ